MKSVPRRIIISRTDSIGDVILTLPVAGVLKKHFPHTKIDFLGRNYTKPVIEACKNVDDFIDADDFLKEGGSTLQAESSTAIIHVFPVAAIAFRARNLHISMRIGTTNRLYHWISCNTLVRLSRKHSPLHEAQLNLQLLRPFGIDYPYSLEEIQGLFTIEKLQPLPQLLKDLIQKDKYNLILHPKSQGSAREWGLTNFIELIRSLDPNRYRIFISGTSRERQLMQPIFDKAADKVTDITGLMNLGEFISFIAHCDGIVANSTGPLHIAAVLGKDALGIYSPMVPIHPARWAPIGPRAQVFVLDKYCEDCKGENKPCHCIMQIDPKRIKNALDRLVGA